ncbi:MAG: organomercurial lyase [SAR324 cluster bacterium]|nr:organomercurial lyase [SAR324 cluster bacterium]
MQAATITDAPDIDRLAASFVELFPQLDAQSGRVAMWLYRLLAEGAPVAPHSLAQAAQTPLARVNELLAAWPGLYCEDGAVIGFWGLTVRPFSEHLFKVDGRTLHTWCAWDTLFIPLILGKTALVESPCPVSGEIIRLTVSPSQVERLEPSTALMSMLEPPEDIAEDIVAKFCHYVYFFSSAQAGAQWCGEHEGAMLMSIEDAFDLGRKKNLMRFGELLAAD